MKPTIQHHEYQKILLKDLASLQELCQNPKFFEEYVNKFLDSSVIADNILFDYIKNEKYNELKEGNLVRFITMNAFDGALKLSKTKKKKRG